MAGPWSTAQYSLPRGKAGEHDSDLSHESDSPNAIEPEDDHRDLRIEIEFEKIGALFDFYREQGGAFAAAAPDALLWVREGHLEAIRQLAASNPDACAHYRPDWVRLQTKTDEADRRILTEAGIRNISTIKVGQEIAFQRPEASQADLSALRYTMLASGFTSHEFSLALSGGQNSDTGTNRRCASNVGFYEALNALPADQADRLTARFLRPGV